MELSRDDSTQLGLESIVSFAGEMEDDMEDRPMSRQQMEQMIQEAEVLMHELHQVERKLIQL
jgi:hypothetical protein